MTEPVPPVPPVAPKPHSGEGGPVAPKPRSGEGGPKPTAHWVTVADAAAVAAALLAAFVLAFGGFVVHAGPQPIRVHGGMRLLFIAAAIATIRHAAHPANPLPLRIVRSLRSSADDAPAAIVRSALVSRFAVLLVGYLAVVSVGVAEKQVGFKVSPDPVVDLPARFDAGWYANIALDGYYFQGRFDRQQNVAFFPAFPLLERVVGYPLGAFAPGVPKEVRTARLLWAGVIVSLIAFAWASVYLFRLARDTIGADRAPAAVALLAAYPFALYFSAAYTESLFLLCAVAAVFHFRRAEFGRAAVWGLLIGLTRPNGSFLSVVLACFIVERLWRERRIPQFRNSQIFKSVASASAPGLGMLIYSAYVKHLTGSWFGWARLHETWGRAYEGLAPVTRAYGWITDEGLAHVVQGVPFDTMNSLGLIFALLMLWPVIRRLGFAYAVFVLINILPPMLAGGVLSMGRITSTLFPLFVALAATVRARTLLPLVTAFAMGQGLATALFFTWRPLF